MEYRAAMVDRKPVEVIAIKAALFPDGIGEAWKRLEARFPPRSGRLFYGLTAFDEGALRYYAAVGAEDHARTTPSGFVRLTVEGGPYARVKLTDWRERTSEFAEIFDFLVDRFEFKPGGYSIEFYRSQREAHLMIPVVSTESARGGNGPGGVPTSP